MTLTTEMPPAVARRVPRREAGLPERIVLYGVNWGTYSFMLDRIGDAAMRLTYDDGVMEICVPGDDHESYKTFIGRLIETASLELGMQIRSFGSSTMRRRSLRKGAEPDESYYLQNAHRVRGRIKIDPKVDPPPDLVVEIDITSDSMPKSPIYAAIGVPELWHFDGEHLRSLQRTEAGEYVVRPRSLAFPFLRMTDIQRFVRRFPKSDENAVIRAWQVWLRKQLGRAR